MISNERLEKALEYLVTTDEPCAQLKADMERSEFKADAIREAVFLRTEGTVAERQAVAKSSREYAAAKEAEFNFMAQYEAMKNKRSTEAIVCDIYRTIQANLRKGSV